MLSFVERSIISRNANFTEDTLLCFYETIITARHKSVKHAKISNTAIVSVGLNQARGQTMKTVGAAVSSSAVSMNLRLYPYIML